MRRGEAVSMRAVRERNQCGKEGVYIEAEAESFCSTVYASAGKDGVSVVKMMDSSYFKRK
jgi:hypothetical protein